ncbi:MAG: ABC transporter permease [Actinobacteria bacterium]|nr:MAG: ABC transporter permease [Actinomycetota bacterium]
MPGVSVRRRASAFLYRHPRVRLLLLLAPPAGWIGVVYLAALAILLVSAFWRLDPLSFSVVHRLGLTNFQILWRESVYRKIAVRTVGISAGVTITDVLLAFPLAYYAARLAGSRLKAAILLSVTLPLWSSYLVRIYAWRLILDRQGLVNWTLHKLHLASVDISFTNWAIWIAFTYLWLPFVFFPIYASLERIPGSFLEASSDMGAKWPMTLRRVILPLALPGIVAGSIFSFSLTLGDYITPTTVGNTQFIGNVVYNNVLGVASNQPFGAAFALVPVAVMAIYLLAARRVGAFEAL